MSTWRISGSYYDIYFAREVPRIPANSTLENTPSATWIDLIEQRAVGATSEERASNFAAPAKRDVPGLRYLGDSPAVMERYYRILGVVSWSESVPEHTAIYVHERVAALLRSDTNPRQGSDETAHASQSN